VLSKNGTPLSLVPDSFLVPSEIIGGIAFLALLAVIYRWIASMADRAAI
jgi:hypothetical protein